MRLENGQIIRASTYVELLSKDFHSRKSRKNAINMSSYVKNRFPFFGIKTPERRRLSMEFIETNGLPDFEQLEELIFALFEQPERELHHFAIEVCGKLKKDWTKETINLFEKMAMTKSWWDSVDGINIFCIRPYFTKFPDEIYEVTQSWIESGNIWLQRLSVICQLRKKEDTDKKLLTRNVLQLNDSEEFFVQKAIGWALRDLAHDDPEWVKDFVAKNDLKPLSKREALKNLK